MFDRSFERNDPFFLGFLSWLGRGLPLYFFYHIVHWREIRLFFVRTTLFFVILLALVLKKIECLHMCLSWSYMHVTSSLFKDDLRKKKKGFCRLLLNNLHYQFLMVGFLLYHYSWCSLLLAYSLRTLLVHL
jgi:hypothetical protein